MKVQIIIDFQKSRPEPWLAAAPMIVSCYAVGDTEEKAIEALRKVIVQRLAGIDNGIIVLSGGRHKTREIEVE